MADTPVQFYAPSDLTLTLELYPHGSDTIANGASGDVCTEKTNCVGLYEATVTEALTGLHNAIVKLGSVPIAGYHVDLLDTTDIHRLAELSYHSIAAIEVSAPVAPNLCTGYLVCLGIDGAPEEDVVIYGKLTEGAGVTGYAYDTAQFTFTSDADGLAEYGGIVPGAFYKFKRGATGTWTAAYEAPMASSWSLQEILGTP